MFKIKVVFIFDLVFKSEVHLLSNCVHFREIYCSVKAIDMCMQT